jgi:hypothetical protein
MTTGAGLEPGGGSQRAGGGGPSQMGGPRPGLPGSGAPKGRRRPQHKNAVRDAPGANGGKNYMTRDGLSGRRRGDRAEYLEAQRRQRRTPDHHEPAPLKRRKKAEDTTGKRPESAARTAEREAQKTAYGTPPTWEGGRDRGRILRPDKKPRCRKK